MKKSNRRKPNPALDDDDSDLDYEDIAPPQKKRASSHKKREKNSPTWKEEEEIEGFTISTLDSPNGSDSKEIHNKHPRENEEEASEGIAALLGLASDVQQQDVTPKKQHRNIFTDPAYSSSESEAKSKESRKHRKALVPVTYTYASSDEDYNSEVYEIEEDDIEDDLVIENDEAEYQPYSQRTMKKKEKEKVRTPKRSGKPRRNIKKRTHYPDDSESSEFSPPQTHYQSTSSSTTRSTVPINPPPAIPTHLPGTVPVVDNNIASILHNELSKPIIKTTPVSPSSKKKSSSSFPTILPGSHHLTNNASNTRNGWRRAATHVAIAQYIFTQQRHDTKQPLIMGNGNLSNGIGISNGNSPNGGKISGIDPTLESKIFKEHASSFAKSPPIQQQQQQSRNSSSSSSSRQLQMSGFPTPKFPPPPPFAQNPKHFTNGFPGNPFPPPFSNPNGHFPPFPPPQGYPGQPFQQFSPFPGNPPPGPGYHTPYPPYSSPLPQQQTPPDAPKTTIKMIPYNINQLKSKTNSNNNNNNVSRKKDPIAASTSNLQLPPPLLPPPFQSRDNFTLRPLNLKR